MSEKTKPIIPDYAQKTPKMDCCKNPSPKLAEVHEGWVEWFCKNCDAVFVQEPKEKE